jgi:hypothetical protein
MFNQLPEPIQKFKTRGALENPPDEQDYAIEDAGPMSLTIVTKEMDDFEE